ncbi:MAG: hypothetical protein A3G39_07230 [Deltaproteobacteria bacterium RIFCSPLOWO2_12_FULL_43_16]|nr:MAG: hypothetical protein A2Z89_06405 [Deltaproteobacteria bacterium GWA2_43_19]OGQ12499.1 MAG: hypothetical protein A3D30_07575 [Deltaproteobacteria bacterium RIFCSPHIGHO2_02_FULL_43_33]OGQ35427.1 MAG: hypothetical protein A3A85_00515 [Deltaproteobacteria bacterium RIFCSPLOWO2_01_FULL_42_9]OGQ61868.1 MAG: hypothetical protein A3G39_07230 [Deltaproteobacteria bacterium RIFCSPLOWO2_12_FULL_43_16]
MMMKAFLNLILPPICPICAQGAEDGRFCQRCFDSIRFIKSPICSCCGTPFVAEESEDHLCGVCIKTKRPFSKARSIGFYEGNLLEAIHRFKYNGKTSLSKPLGKIMLDRFSPNNYDLIVPVPLHRARLKERGFNQSLLLARELARTYKLPIDYLNLKKIRATDAQINLKGKDRVANVKGAFAVEDDKAFDGKRVLLIDDVYTTGATIVECGKVLKKAGAKDIDVLTLARVVNL